MILALSGGVGGAKFAAGLSDVVASDELTIVVNTGDDFDYLGLRVMPDLDSVLYALASVNDTQRGWGRAEETWVCNAALDAMGVDNWFMLGDKDLATHLWRHALLSTGASFTGVAHDLASRLGVKCAVVPMSDQVVSTLVHTEDDVLSFQDYFVRKRCEPKVRFFAFHNSASATPASRWFLNVAQGKVDGMVICPSNPFVSIDPILSLPRVRTTLLHRNFPAVAVSPIVGGKSVKGPLAKMLKELGKPCNPITVAEHYGSLIQGIVIDHRDEQYEVELRTRGLEVEVCETLMTDREVARDLAQHALGLLKRCGRPNAA